MGAEEERRWGRPATEAAAAARRAAADGDALAATRHDTSFAFAGTATPLDPAQRRRADASREGALWGRAAGALGGGRPGAPLAAEFAATFGFADARTVRSEVDEACAAAAARMAETQTRVRQLARVARFRARWRGLNDTSSGAAAAYEEASSELADLTLRASVLASKGGSVSAMRAQMARMRNNLVVRGRGRGRRRVRVCGAEWG